MRAGVDGFDAEVQPRRSACRWTCWSTARAISAADHVVCIDERNPYFQMIRSTWGQRLREVFDSLEDPRWDGGDPSIRCASLRRATSRCARSRPERKNRLMPNAATIYPGAITDVAGLRVGHFTESRRPTGCSVLLCESGAIAGVDVRGAAPGTRETDLLKPDNLVERVHAILLTGGSAFGLDAATGVMRWLEEHGFGLRSARCVCPSCRLPCSSTCWSAIRASGPMRPRATRPARPPAMCRRHRATWAPVPAPRWANSSASSGA